MTETVLGSPDSTVVESSRCDPEIQYFVVVVVVTTYRLIVRNRNGEFSMVLMFCALCVPSIY